MSRALADGVVDASKSSASARRVRDLSAGDCAMRGTRAATGLRRASALSAQRSVIVLCSDGLFATRRRTTSAHR